MINGILRNDRYKYLINMIKINNISKCYGKKKILEDVSFTISPGECISLLGINGAGKTTLSSIIAGIKAPSSGDIFYKNNSIYNDISSYKKTIGFCQQTPNLDSNLTLKENLIFSGRFFGLSSEQTLNQLKELSLKFHLDSYLDYYDYQLSGGFKQRFMIARSLMHHPSFLILDEPTVAMDPNVRRELWEILKELKRTGVSILLTTHYLEEAEILSDKICILHKGKIKINNTVENLLKQFNKETLEDVFISFLDECEKTAYKKESHE